MRHKFTSLSLDAIEHCSEDGRDGYGPSPDGRSYQPGSARHEHRPQQIDSDEQGRVAEHFQHTAAEWRDIYYRHNLYSLLYQERKRVVLSLVDGLGMTPGARVLDIGCGPGLITLALAQRGYAVDAIDIAPAMIDMTRQLIGESGLGCRVRAIEGDVRDLSFADDSFDLVLAVGVTEWLASLEHPLSEIGRVLRPGGFTIITADNSWNLHSVLDPLYNPLLSSLRGRMHRVLQRVLGIPLGPRYYQRSVQQLDSCLRRSQLEKIRRMTLGFGAFRFFGRQLCSESMAIKMHHKLQTLADKNWPVLRSTGRVYIAVAEKPANGRDAY
jgi:ubiquinone/menaquinone biosynthesis C-methylase UbiE